MNRRPHLTALAVAVLALLPALPGSAAADGYGEDPSRLVPFRTTVSGAYSSGDDVWDVWVCSVPGWDIDLDLAKVTSDLNRIISPYFGWLSAGRYRPYFRAAGYVASDDHIDTSTGFIHAPGCEAAAGAASTSSPEGALIVVEGGNGAGYAHSGYVCPPPFSGCPTTFPDNRRRAVLGAGVVTTVSPATEPRWMAAAHEIGHTLSWAHSYSGATSLPDGSVNQYDNPIDVMSGLVLRGLPVGTLAYHRYAAGWIDPSEVAIHASGTRTYPMSQTGERGVGMVVLPLGADGYFYSLDLRTEDGWDQPLAATGVSSHLVDSRPGSCTPDASWPAGYPCFGMLTRISQTPFGGSATSTDHVHLVGDSFALGLMTLTVLQDDAGRIHLRVSDGNYAGRFVDDDTNFHQPNIEVIASAGLTKGCDPPANDRYCPTQLVSRASMAAFLIRALGQDTALPSYHGYFPDVPADEWYTPYVERLFELGITTGNADGTFDPHGAVTRAEMAAFVTRAFGLQSGAPSGVFSDVPAESWYLPHAEALYAHGVTTGCGTDPVRYCPAEAVPRDQMASFLARALGIGS